MGSGLVNGPIGPGAVHLCLDMQRLFAPGGPWPAPWAARVLPAVVALADHDPERSVFTRFVPPHTPDTVGGAWRSYYEKWRQVTREQLDDGLLALVPELSRFVPPAHVVDKGRYSAFSSPTLPSLFAALRADTLILSGAETDVCVLATLFDAVDCGFRTVLARDAVCSSADAGHDAVLAMLDTRLSVQVEVADTAEILAAWTAPA
ncbi:cysteine hydrolase family protein [Oharaeibacter diazotrophicus]|uniref:Nicotinamidase-related amidase n=1 Tax=Oharaeibacter diazotrophicus TaxID=1920512 RepID=A0A4R6RAY4_9HYPH|nr:cysteine hydrolase [Oharaeibacter diazotrophicus]TDP83095.1 nicotinamidase-related amidase [Oharaeibacter diazotrophicus]BBE71926.1 maleamate amidohydrolase [Pleomorphomonas sp. SM30]GLS78689.1 cysteine hydrolase [Oharaeibacter diazotrophicus]